MSRKPVTRTPEQTEAALVGGILKGQLSFAAFGIGAGLLYDPAACNVVVVYEAQREAGNPDPGSLPGFSAKVIAAFLAAAAPAIDLPALALQVRDRWQRDQLKSRIDNLITVLVGAQQDAVGMTSEAPAQVMACTLMGTLLDTLASLRMIVDPLPVLLAKPAHEASTLAYMTAAELGTLASALDMVATGCLNPPSNALMLQRRAAQLREIAAVQPVTLPAGAVPTSGLLH